MTDDVKAQVPLAPAEIAKIQASSVQKFDDSRAQSLLIYFAVASDDTPRWWSPSRDRYLREFWPLEPYLAGALYSICARNSSFKFAIEGPPRQARRVERLLAQMGFGAGWQVEMMKVSLDLLCLAATSRVHLGGDRRGKTKTIREIVAQRDSGPVMSVDTNGRLVERHITEWHKTPLGDRRWWWISLKHASGHARKRPGGLFLTEDHPVLTTEGWLEAKDVRVGMRVASGDPQPTDQQMELLVGSLLGDLGMQFIRKRAALHMSHSTKQVGWFDHKLEALKGFQWTGRKSYKTKMNCEFLNIASRGSLGLVELYNTWYPDGKKIVPREQVTRYFTPRMLAVWYCDDGSMKRNYVPASDNETAPDCNLYTQGFTREDSEWLATLLCSKGFSCMVYTHKQGNGKMASYIHLSTEGFRCFVEAIGPYVPPSMRYKLPEDSPPYDPDLWEAEPATAYFDVVVASEQRDYKTGYNTAKTTFHIGVAGTGNFIAANTVVHNTQDNGAFIEVIRPARITTKEGTFPAVKTLDATGESQWYLFDDRGRPKELKGVDYEVRDSPYDQPVGLAHLDAARCTRTGDPTYPVVYTDIKGFSHKMAFWQVITFEDMPSPQTEMNGVGYCAVTRVMNLARTLRDMQLYKSEKIGGRFNRAIHLTNAGKIGIEKALAEQETRADSAGLMRYVQPLIVSSMDPTVQISLKTIELASLPEGFSEEETLKWYIAGLALGTGVDYGFLAPLPGRGIGTGSESEVQERSAKGKSSRLFMRLIETKFNYNGVLPRSCTLSHGEIDPEEESLRDEAADRRATTRQTRITSGEITPEIARKIAFDDGDLKQEYLEELQASPPEAEAEAEADQQVDESGDLEPVALPTFA